MEFKNPESRVVYKRGLSRQSRWVGCGFFVLTGVLGVPQAQSASQDSLTVNEVLNLAQNHPMLEALQSEVQARKALVKQAGVIPNPRLSLEAENFAGTGPFSGTQAMETTARLEQTVELGGKRSLRRDRAEAELLLAEADLATRMRTVVRTVRGLFDDLLVWQERSLLAVEKVRVLNEASGLAKRRLDAGRGTLAEDLKMRLELSRARAELSRAKGETEAARNRLSSFLGATSPSFAGVRGDIKQRESLPAWDIVNEKVLNHPELTRWQSEKTLRALSQKAARAENIPDLEFNAGMRQMQGPGQDNTAFVGGISIPLPLWNRNSGAIAGASYRVAGAEKEELAARRELLEKARTLWDGLRIRAEELDRLAEELIPESQKANAAAQTAYSAGRFNSLELLDGQRLLFEVNEQYIEALAAYHRDFAELGALAGLAHTLEEKKETR
jgi:cobalt-zinc-cadmium efflux system outer membrane protein